MYKKLGASISKSGFRDICYFGSKCIEEDQKPDQVNDDFIYSRSIFKRTLRAFSFFFFIVKRQPDLLIITTWELLLPALFSRLLARASIIYDIQENYYKNEKNKGVTGRIRALIIRGLEQVSSQFIVHFFLAERCYEEELGFTKKKSTLLENKALESFKDLKSGSKLYDLFYGGTIADQTGLRQVEMICELIKDKDIKISTYGHCPSQKDLDRVKALAKKYSFFEAQVSEVPKSHNELLEKMTKARYNLALYPPNPAIENRIPTKFFEGIVLGITLITIENKTYQNFFNAYGGGIIISDLNEIFPILKMDQINKEQIHPPNPDLLWESSENRIKSTLSEIFNLSG